MSLEFHDSLNQSEAEATCISLDTESFEKLVMSFDQWKAWSDIEYVLKIKIAFYSTRRTIIHWVSLIKSQYSWKEKEITGLFFSCTP